MELSLSGANFNTADLIIDLDEAPPKPNGAAPPPIPEDQQQQQQEKQPAPQKSVEDEAVDRLRKQMEAKLAAKEEENRALREQAAKDRAERVKAEGGIRTAEWAKELSEYDAVNAAHTAAKNQIASLKAAYKDAHEAGDAFKIGDIQERISVEAAKLVQFEMARDQLHDRLEKRKNEPAPKEDVAPPADPVEAFISHNKLTTKAAQWFRENPEFVRDQEKMHLVIAADTAARKEGLKRDSDEYFEYVNSYVGKDAGTDEDDATERKPAPKPRGRSVPAAPVNSGKQNLFSASNLDGRTIRLKPNLREAAEAAFPDVPPGDAHKQYVANAIALIKAGELPKNFFD